MAAGPRPVDGDFADSHLRSRRCPARGLPEGRVAGDAAVAVNSSQYGRAEGQLPLLTTPASWTTWRRSSGRAARLADHSPVQLALDPGGRSARGWRCWDARASSAVRWVLRGSHSLVFRFDRCAHRDDGRTDSGPGRGGRVVPAGEPGPGTAGSRARRGTGPGQSTSSSDARTAAALAGAGPGRRPAPAGAGAGSGRGGGAQVAVLDGAAVDL